MLANKKVITEFLKKNFNLSASSVSSNEDKLFSYSTIIAQWFGDTLLVNTTKYSVTTSKAQGNLIHLIGKNINWYTVDNISKGTSDLKYLYHG